MSSENVRFLEDLQDPNWQLGEQAAFLMPLPGSWGTAPRSPGRSFPVNYLFWSPKARLRIVLSECTREVEPMTLCWFPPGLYYEVKMLSPNRVEPILRLRFQLRRGSHLAGPSSEALFREYATDAGSLFHACAESFVSSGKLGEYRQRCQLGLLSAYALEATSAPDQGILPPGAMQRLRSYVAQHLDGRPRPEELASLLGYQPAYFRRVFRATTGLSPRRWLLEWRLHLAAQRILESQGPIGDIAAEFGYENALLFSRQFKQVHGISPTEWRRAPRELRSSEF